MNVDLHAVAAEAGVSKSTVSNLLNQPAKVAPATAAKINAAIERLGYVRNDAAAQLRAGRSQSIGLVVINITNPFFSDVTLGAESLAQTEGLSVILGNSYDSTEKESRYLDLFQRQRLDGVIVSPIGDIMDRLSQMQDRGTPVILVDHYDDRQLISSVTCDNRLGGRLAAKHLVDMGCQRISFLGGLRTDDENNDEPVQQIHDRFLGFKDHMDEVGMPFLEFWSHSLSLTIGREAGKRLLALPEDQRPDGVVASNDLLALGVIQECVSAGVRVPEDIAVVGYDDIEFASAAAISLTSVHQPSFEMGRRAAEMLVAAIGAEVPPPYEAVRFEPQLIVRESSRRH